MKTNTKRRIASEFLGTAFLLSIVVGSGMMGDQLSQGNAAVGLLANSLATGAGLIVLILIFGSISGAHFNPVVSLVESLRGKISKQITSFYIIAQTLGAFAGVAIAHFMFKKELFSFSEHARSGSSQLLSEFIATFGLISVIRGVGRSHQSEVPYAVGLYITCAYWFTSSTSFANPVATLARAFTPTFAGIRPVDVLPFIVVQVLGGLTAELLFRLIESQPIFRKS